MCLFFFFLTMNSRRREEEEEKTVKQELSLPRVLKEQFAQILKFGHYLLTGGVTR